MFTVAFLNEMIFFLLGLTIVPVIKLLGKVVKLYITVIQLKRKLKREV